MEKGRLYKWNVMKTLVYNKLDKHRCEEKTKITIKKSTDSIIRITKSTICGSELLNLISKR